MSDKNKSSFALNLNAIASILSGAALMLQVTVHSTNPLVVLIENSLQSAASGISAYKNDDMKGVTKFVDAIINALTTFRDNLTQVS